MTRILLAAVAALLLAPAAARADVFTVSGLGEDDGSCTAGSCPSIRSALDAAGQTSGADTINVPAGTTQLTHSLQPSDQVTLVGAGANRTTIAAAPTDRVFDVPGEITVTSENLTMQGGTDAGDTSGGGTLRIGSSGTVTLDHVRVTGGTATIGGGIFDDGARLLTITHSLVDGNSAQGQGGGIETQGIPSASQLELSDTTITGNTAVTGGGIDVQGSVDTSATTDLQRVTIALNRAQSGSDLYVADPGIVQVGGSIVTSCGGTRQPQSVGANLESGTACGFSIQGADPQLGALADDGGQTPALALSATSPAVDRGGPCGPATDQRDIARPQGLACDLGAYELIPADAPPPPAPTSTPTATPTATPTPVAGTTVVVKVTDGTVRVKRPGKSSFTNLDGTQGIPLGSTVDTKNGEIQLTSQQKKGGKPQTAKFFDGIFKITQTKTTTDLTLNEALAKCASGKKASAAAAKKPETRKLWGNGSGSFRTRGQYSAATVRGTEWLVQDSCSGTLTRVKHGVVSVRDNVTHKTILLRAGKHYLARPRR